MKKTMMIVASLLLVTMCSFVLVGCFDNPEKTLKGVEDATAYKITVDTVTTKGATKKTETLIDGDKMKYTEETFILYTDGKVRLDEIKQWYYWKDNGELKVAYREGGKTLKDIADETAYQSKYDELKADEKYFQVIEMTDMLKSTYDNYLQRANVSGNDLGEDLDGLWEYYGKEKGKLLSEKQDDGTLKIQFQNKMVNDVYYPNTTWGVKDKKLVYKVRHLVTDNQEYYYYYDAQTVTVPEYLNA